MDKWNASCPQPIDEKWYIVSHVSNIILEILDRTASSKFIFVIIIIIMIAVKNVCMPYTIKATRGAAA